MELIWVIALLIVVVLVLFTSRHGSFKTNLLTKTNLKDFPVLRQYSRDLTLEARQGKLDPVVGREREIHRVIQILSRRTKNNPVLIGKTGVGKTSIAEGLAQEIANGTVPEILLNKKVLALDLSGIVAGTKFRGEFEQRLKRITDEIIRSNRSIILFIDEIHTLAEAGEATGAIDADDILKPPLARGDLQVVGATTPQEYKDFIKKDVTLDRRLQPVLVEEPTPEETVKILMGIKERYEQHHRVQIPEKTVRAAVILAKKNISDRYFPDKAIDLVDEAGAKVRLSVVKKISPKTRLQNPVVTVKDIEEVVREWRRSEKF